MSCDLREDCACRDPDAQENNKGARHRSIGWAEYPWWHPGGGRLGNHSSLHAAYKRAFPLTPHSNMPSFPHQTATTQEGMTLKKQTTQPNTSTTGFTTDIKRGSSNEWLTFGNSNHRLVLKLRLKEIRLDWRFFCCCSFNVCFHWWLFVKRNHGDFYLEQEEKKWGRGIHMKIPNESKITKLKWMFSGFPLNIWPLHVSV